MFRKTNVVTSWCMDGAGQNGKFGKEVVAKWVLQCISLDIRKWLLKPSKNMNEIVTSSLTHTHGMIKTILTPSLYTQGEWVVSIRNVLPKLSRSREFSVVVPKVPLHLASIAINLKIQQSYSTTLLWIRWWHILTNVSLIRTSMS